MRCRICDRVLCNESSNRNPLSKREQLCRDCAHVCELIMPAVYFYNYTSQAKKDVDYGYS